MVYLIGIEDISKLSFFFFRIDPFFIIIWEVLFRRGSEMSLSMGELE